MTHPLIELAQLRSEVVEIQGHKVVVMEPGALVAADYARKQREGGVIPALALLIERCVMGEDGKPAFTADEALVIAGGRSEVFTPIVNSLTQYRPLEKKPLSTPSSDSNSG